MHTALYRYIQPVIAGLLAVTRGQAHFNRVNLTAAGFIFTGVILVAVGYRYSLRHSLHRILRRRAASASPASSAAPAGSSASVAAASPAPAAWPELPSRYGLPRLRSDGRLPHYSASSRRRHSSGTGRLH